MSEFYNKCALSDTSITLSAFVLHTFYNASQRESISFLRPNGYHDFQDDRHINHNKQIKANLSPNNSHNWNTGKGYLASVGAFW